MPEMDRFLFVAIHKGPYLSIQPLEEALGAGRFLYLVEGVARQERADQGLTSLDLGQIQEEWGSLEDYLRRAQVRAVIRSSSEDVPGVNAEELASTAATNCDTPVFVVEDFPGNYWPRPGHRLDSLFVEDNSLVGLHCSRGTDPGVIYNTGNPRYSWLMSVDRDGQRLKARKALGLANEPVILWAGQPDGDNSYWALERLLRHFNRHRVTLLFRAHPRDLSYQTGKYDALLAETNMRVVDVSPLPDVVGLYCAADLVLTQFSSAGVEASYLGVPTLFVLFEDLGKKYLMDHKGYDRLPWCEVSGAFLIEREDEIADVTEQALFDSSSRDKVSANFQRTFGARSDSALLIAHRIRQIISAASAGGTCAGRR